MECDDNSLPKFGMIREIFVANSKIIIVYTNLKTIDYCDILNAYKVEMSANQIEHAINNKNLLFPHPSLKVNQSSETYCFNQS